MASIFTIGQRRISGRGLILPTLEQLSYRRYMLYADIIRKPLTPYFNADFFPTQTYYGTISLQNEDYTTQTLIIEKDRQMWFFDADTQGQGLIAVKCQYKGVLQSFANLGSALGLTVISVDDKIADFKNVSLQWDKIYVQCYADTALQITLKALDYDVCNPSDRNAYGTGEKPNLPNPVMPGTPTEISPPYEGDEITKKASIDESYNPQVPGTWAITNTEGNGSTQTFNVSGVASDVFRIVTPGTNCSQAFSSNLVRNENNEIIFAPFNCNNSGFISVILSQVFTPS